MCKIVHTHTHDTRTHTHTYAHTHTHTYSLNQTHFSHTHTHTQNTHTHTHTSHTHTHTLHTHTHTLTHTHTHTQATWGRCCCCCCWFGVVVVVAAGLDVICCCCCCCCGCCCSTSCTELNNLEPFGARPSNRTHNTTHTRSMQLPPATHTHKLTALQTHTSLPGHTLSGHTHTHTHTLACHTHSADTHTTRTYKWSNYCTYEIQLPPRRYTHLRACSQCIFFVFVSLAVLFWHSSLAFWKTTHSRGNYR